MITTHVAAYNSMCARIRAASLQASVASLIGYTPELRYGDVSYASNVDGSKYWLRFTLIQAGELKRTLSQPSRITYHGIADLQVFAPSSDNEAARKLSFLAQDLALAYNSSTESVDFTKAAIRDMPRETQWFYKRVNATYTYDVMEQKL